MNTAFHARWLAISEVSSKYYSPQVAEEAIRASKVNVRPLFRYIKTNKLFLRCLFGIYSNNYSKIKISYHFSPPLRWILFFPDNAEIRRYIAKWTETLKSWTLWHSLDISGISFSHNTTTTTQCKTRDTSSRYVGQAKYRCCDFDISI